MKAVAARRSPVGSWPALLIFLLTVAAYSPSLRNGFINYDDPLYLTQNPWVQQGLSFGGMGWAFTHFAASNWHPVTWISHMIDWQLFGAAAWGHHLMSVLLHAVGSVLLFVFFSSATYRRGESFFVAAFFALHPVHVESVAWAAERKDVLSILFLFGSMVLYLRWTRSQRPGRPLYLGSLALFALALMSKPMAMSMPALLLLADYWPLQRLSPGHLQKRLSEKIPFFLLSLASGVVTIMAQSAGGAVKDFSVTPLIGRLANALVSVVRYLGKVFYPVDLAVFYPYPTHWPGLVVLGCGITIVAISASAFCLRRQAPYLLFGWAWFLISLVPVIGLVQVGGQSMADRYLYLPFVGLAVPLVWGIARLLSPVVSTKFQAAFAIVVLAVCSGLTSRQIFVWRTNETLFRHALAVTKGNVLAHWNLGADLAERGLLAEAIAELRAVVALSPDSSEAHRTLGIYLAEAGQLSPARAHLEEALRLQPDDAEAHVNLGIVLDQQGHPEGAIAEYRAALAKQPEHAYAHQNLGRAFERRGQLNEALAEYELAIRFRPEYAPAHANRGIVLKKLGRVAEAAIAYRQALHFAPDNRDALMNLGILLFQKGEVEEGTALARELTRHHPGLAEGYYNLGGMLSSQARYDEAIAAYQTALGIKPDYGAARRNLSVTQEARAAASTTGR